MSVRPGTGCFLLFLPWLWRVRLLSAVFSEGARICVRPVAQQAQRKNRDGNLLPCACRLSLRYHLAKRTGGCRALSNAGAGEFDFSISLSCCSIIGPNLVAAGSLQARPLRLLINGCVALSARLSSWWPMLPFTVVTTEKWRLNSGREMNSAIPERWRAPWTAC